MHYSPNVLYYNHKIEISQINTERHTQRRVQPAGGRKKRRKELTMKHEIVKAAKGYILVISREDGTRNDYRFNTKAELNRWMKRAGMEARA